MTIPKPLRAMREIGDALRDFAPRHAGSLLLALGVASRVAFYLPGRYYWLDESSLAWVIVETPLGRVTGPLSHSQLAPSGFLAVERVVQHFLGGGGMSLRLVPLLGGLAGLWLFRELAVRYLSARGALLALGIFAISDDLNYFASELKPYSTDLAVAVACTLAALRRLDAPTPSNTIALAVFGSVAAWFSFPATFVLAGIGLVLFAWAAVRRNPDNGPRSTVLGAMPTLAVGMSSIGPPPPGMPTASVGMAPGPMSVEISSDARRNRPAVLGLTLLGLAWCVSLAGVQWVARRQLIDPRAMQVFWNFSFPAHRLDVAWPLRAVAYLFANPMSLYIPGIGWTVPAMIGFGLFLVGGFSMARRDFPAFALLAAPLILTLIAAYLRLYPFHGRVVLFLVPALILPIAEGADRLAAAVGSRASWRLLVVWLAVLPASWTLLHLMEPRFVINPNSHGDRRPARVEPGRFPWRP